jgi:hypothetical protein
MTACLMVQRASSSLAARPDLRRPLYLMPGQNHHTNALAAVAPRAAGGWPVPACATACWQEHTA